VITARQRRGKDFSAEMSEHATKELMEAMISMRSLPRLDTPSTGRVAINSHAPPLVEEEFPFQSKQKSWKEEKYVHGSRRDPKQDLLSLRGPVAI
jgi:hypothetical protein